MSETRAHDRHECIRARNRRMLYFLRVADSGRDDQYALNSGTSSWKLFRSSRSFAPEPTISCQAVLPPFAERAVPQAPEAPLREVGGEGGIVGGGGADKAPTGPKDRRHRRKWPDRPETARPPPTFSKTGGRRAQCSQNRDAPSGPSTVCCRQSAATRRKFSSSRSWCSAVASWPTTRQVTLCSSMPDMARSCGYSHGP